MLMLMSTLNRRTNCIVQLLAKEPTTKDPKAVIEKNNAVRSNLRALEENWKELDGAYQAEKNKRRVRYRRQTTWRFLPFARCLFFASCLLPLVVDSTLSKPVRVVYVFAIYCRNQWHDLIFVEGWLGSIDAVSFMPQHAVDVGDM